MGHRDGRDQQLQAKRQRQPPDKWPARRKQRPDTDRRRSEVRNHHGGRLVDTSAADGREHAEPVPGVATEKLTNRARIPVVHRLDTRRFPNSQSGRRHSLSDLGVLTRPKIFAKASDLLEGIAPNKEICRIQVMDVAIRADVVKRMPRSLYPVTVWRCNHLASRRRRPCRGQNVDRRIEIVDGNRTVRIDEADVRRGIHARTGVPHAADRQPRSPYRRYLARCDRFEIFERPVRGSVVHISKMDSSGVPRRRKQARDRSWEEAHGVEYGYDNRYSLDPRLACDHGLMFKASPPAEPFTPATAPATP